MDESKTGPCSPFGLIAALHVSHGGIGVHNTIPWRIPADLKHFAVITECATVIMGRRTWESIPDRFLPLSGRENIVVSTTLTDIEDGVVLANSLDDALEKRSRRSCFVIGGSLLYRDALCHPQCEMAHLTWVDASSTAERLAFDTFFPVGNLHAQWVEATSDKWLTLKSGLKYRFSTWTRSDSIASSIAGNRDYVGERGYLSLLAHVMKNGKARTDRTGTGTLSVFGERLVFDLRDDAFPLLTTKRMGLRWIAEELFWFVSGSTDAMLLKEKGVTIWDGNGTREFLDGRGLSENRVGDLGPVYGFQWRHFGAEYSGCDADYVGKGTDQIADVLRSLASDPTSRRHVVSAWNAAALDRMALPPCHMTFQFYVEADGALSCQMYQRSADLGLGVPFNIASYALLTRMMAHVLGRETGKLILVIGDAHIYLPHVATLKRQCERVVKAPPTLIIVDVAKEGTALDRLLSIQFANLKLEEYKPASRLSMKMAV